MLSIILDLGDEKCFPVACVARSNVKLFSARRAMDCIFLLFCPGLVREGTFFLGGGGLGNFGIFFPKKCWPSLVF